MFPCVNLSTPSRYRPRLTSFLHPYYGGASNGNFRDTEGGHGSDASCALVHLLGQFQHFCRVPEELEGDSPNVRYRVRIDFANLLLLAHGNRPVTRIVAAGSVPPELATLWAKMEEKGVRGLRLSSATVMATVNNKCLTKHFRWRCSMIVLAIGIFQE